MVGAAQWLALSRPDIHYSAQAYADANFAGEVGIDEGSGEYTSGGVIALQGVVLTTYGRTQSLVARSAAEVELLALNSGLAEALFVQSSMMDMDSDADLIPVQAWTDSTACWRIAQRLGVGKLRHLANQEVRRTRQVELAKTDCEPKAGRQLALCDVMPVALSEEDAHLLRTMVGAAQWLALSRPDIHYSAQAYADANFAGEVGIDEGSGEYTSGGVIALQGVVLTTYGRTQSLVARSAAEVELLALNSGLAEALFVQSSMMDMDSDADLIPVQAWTDSTACLRIAQRLGVGKLRHLANQEVRRTRQVELAKTDCEPKVADNLTKQLQPARLEQPEGHVGLPEAAGADDVQPDQLNMMCEEETPLPLCPECHQVCVHCAEACRGRRAAAASSGSSTWERVFPAVPGVSTWRRPKAKAIAKARAVPAVSTGRRPPADSQAWTTTRTSATTTSTTWRPTPRPVARAAAAEGQQQTPARPDKFANLQGQATNSQLDYIGLLSRRLGVEFDAVTAAASLSKQEASELIDSLLQSRLPREPLEQNRI
ncbi:unnamed protein product [Polarella glacialis]|uniref:Uncharacterized protein n=1 Tax=Polarella glacialis TaxID=89957 RepID=A0A813E9A0_POLGL|nr:unnamed protein product [Polarella glacialis]